MASSPTAARSERRRPGRPRQDERSQAVREALLDAATELAVERGFDAVGTREIAERAGASQGMIAYYFGDKQGLYVALFERAFERMSGQVEAMLGAEGPNEGSLDGVIDLHVSALAADPWIPQLIAREVLARDTPVRKTFEQRVGDGPMTMMVDWIEREIAAGRLRSDLHPELTAMSIAALAIGWPGSRPGANSVFIA